MKVSMVLLMVSVSWVAAWPGQKWNQEEESKGGGLLGLAGGLQGGLQQTVGKLSGLLAGGKAGGLLEIIPGGASNSGLLNILGGEKGGDVTALLKGGGGEKVLLEAISKLILSKGGDEGLVEKVLGILGKGGDGILSILKGIIQPDKGSQSSLEKEVLGLVKGLLKGEGGDLLEKIKKLLGKLGKGGQGGKQGGGKGGKQRGGQGSGEKDSSSDESDSSSEESEEKGSAVLEGSVKTKILDIIEEKISGKLELSGSKQGLGGVNLKELEKSKKEILKKVEKQVVEKEKSGAKLEESEILSTAEETITKVLESGSSLLKKLGGGKKESSGDKKESSSSETIEVSVREKITKVTEEKLTEELKQSGALGEGKEKLSSEQLTKCNEVILKKVEEEVREKQKDGAKLEESEVLRITEEVIKKEAKSESILKIVGDNASDEEIVDASLWEKITKVTKEKLDAELKQASSSGKLEVELSSKELEKCNERVLKVIKDKIREEKKSGKKLEESEVLREVDEIIEKEVKGGSLLVEIRGDVKVEASAKSQSASEKKEE